MNLKYIILYIVLTVMGFNEALSQEFNKSKDLLLANFDLKPDEDDIMASAALACMLKHEDFKGVNYYAVAGAYGDQNHIFITEGIPDFFNSLFGPENINWTNAHENWNASVSRVKNKVIPILNSGGKIFVQEAGQSNFTFDVLQAVIKEGVTISTVQKNVIIVQHSKYNEKNTTPSELTWLKQNTVYKKIDDGNTADNQTPGYRSKETQWLELAKSTENPNTIAKNLWTLADEVCDAWDGEWTNKWIAAGGVDFSDCVENWHIFNLGEDVGNIESFWNRYVINKTVPSPTTYGQKRRSNPIISHMFTADPSAHVWEDGRLYVYPSTDNAPPRGYKTMDGYHVFSTDDMITWKDHGEILHSSQVDWGRKEGGFMWAPDCAYKDGLYYYYFPHPSGTKFKETWKIGVATSTKPASDFKVQGYIKDLPSLIDPCVFVDNDNQAYLYIAGNDECHAVKLKDNMMEIDGELTKQTGLDGLREGPFVFKRNNIYYLIYPDDFPKFNKMRYAMSKNPLGPWKNNEVFLESTDVITTHGSVVEYKGQWYLFYHNGNLSGGIGPNRSICFDPIYFNEDGTIQMIKQTLGVELPTFHKDINFNGMMGALSVGDYNQDELQKHGIQPNDISSIEIPKGYRVEGFEKDNFTGKPWVFEENRIDLNDIGCNDVFKSLKISIFKDENRVENASFELATQEQIKYWVSRRSSQLYKRALDNTAKGYYVMQYEGNGDAQPMTQNVELSPNTKYELSVKLKVDAGTKGKVIFDTNGSFDTTCKFELDANTKADQWVEFKGVFNSENLSAIELRCLTSEDFNGTAYWDDVVLKVKS